MVSWNEPRKRSEPTNLPMLLPAYVETAAMNRHTKLAKNPYKRVFFMLIFLSARINELQMAAIYIVQLAHNGHVLS